MHIIALIPARKGSKRLPGKNVKQLLGKPLIQYSIEHAKSVDKVDEIIVSTDSEEAKEISLELGCQVIERPIDLATDTAKTIDVVRHVVEEKRKAGFDPTHILLLQPTNPIREISSLNDSINILIETGCDSVTSHYLLDMCHPERLKTIQDGRVTPFLGVEERSIARSELDPVYCRDGSIYAFRANLPFEGETLLGKNQRSVISNRDYAVNIDQQRDWIIAESLLIHYGKSLL